MRFSVVVPAYNVEAYLDECLGSVVAQSYEDWEVIIIDDGSTDGTGRMADEWREKDSRIRVVHQDNRGLSAARNTGIEHTKGDYVLLLDGDDWLEKDALEQIADALHDEDVLCFTGRRYFQEYQRFEEKDEFAEKTYSCGGDYYTENALKSRHFAFVSVVLRAYRRQFLEEHNLRFKEGVFHEDNLFTPQVCYYAKKVRVIDKCLYNYRVHEGSIMTSPSLRKLQDKVLVANDLARFFIPKENIAKNVVYQFITHMYQTVFDKPNQEEKTLSRLVDWDAYRIVSRTKLRHRAQYSALRISPALFRLIVKMTSR